jgi:hypothetical protein
MTFDEKAWNSKHVVEVTCLLQEARPVDQTKMVACAVMQTVETGEPWAVWVDYRGLLLEAELMVAPFSTLRDALLSDEARVHFDTLPAAGHVRLFHTTNGHANWVDLPVKDLWPEVAEIDWTQPKIN